MVGNSSGKANNKQLTKRSHHAGIPAATIVMRFVTLASNPMTSNNGNDKPGDPGKLATMANAIRFLSMDAVEAAKSGHPGMPMGMADVATVLFTSHMKFDPALPKWHDRDRFVLSAGHGSMLLYALLYLLGYEDMSLDEIKAFRQVGSRTAGHPEFGHVSGIETTTGPLGQGLANGVGMALGERLMNARFGDAVVDHRTYVIAGDGCLMEGLSHEAIDLAGHLQLAKLTVLWDDNGITIDGETRLTTSLDQQARFSAAGWHVQAVDGHDHEAIGEALENARQADRPSLIACKTTIGFGAPEKQGTSAAHGAPLGADEIAATRKALAWPYDPFELPSEIIDAWRLAGLRGGPMRKAWRKRLKALDNDTRGAFERAMRGDLPGAFESAVTTLKQEIAAQPKAMATRKASQAVLDALNPVVPETIGGSADLTGSNNTRSSDMAAITANDFSGRYMYYGVREHAMGAIMNGLALHGGSIPYGGTFLVFSDYARPAIRLAALMRQRVIYVLTHDSIGLGEDGPTHQPVEHLAALRAIPNLNVYRPADMTETLECWQLALQTTDAPSAIVLSRQTLPAVRTEAETANRCARGAYDIAQADGDERVSLFASGSEVAVALEAQAHLAKAGYPTRVVSVPSLDLFAAQSGAYQNAIIGDAPVKVAIEAAVRQGWDAVIGPDGIFIGMDGFGASGPGAELFAHFDITSKAAVDAVLARLHNDRPDDDERE